MFGLPQDADLDDQLYPLLNKGLALYAAGKPFEAHEVWEFAWKVEVGRTKLTLQALILIAAGLYKRQLNSLRGPSKLLAKALAKIEEIREGASAWLGIDLVQLHADVARALKDADAYAQSGEGELYVPRLPEVSGPCGVIYLHGFASSPGSYKATQIVPPLREAGFSVAVPDLNEDDFFNLTVSRALDQIRRLMRDRTVVIGSSLGGYLASLLAAKDDRVKGLVLMAPAFDIASRLEKRYGEEEMAQWKSKGQALVDHYGYGEPRPISYGFFEDARNHPARPTIRAQTHVLQGKHDDVVPADMVQEVAAQHAKVTFELLDDDHSLGGSAPRALQVSQQMLQSLGFEPEPQPENVEAILADWPED